MSRFGWYYLDKSERRALLFLLFVLLLLCAGFHWVRHVRNVRSEENEASPELLMFSRQMRADSMNRIRRRGGVMSAELFPFDPNQADSVTLVRLGLRSWQVRNILRYRRKGGKWKSADDFARLYGLSREEFLRLRPYIYVSARQEFLSEKTERRDTFPRKYPEKMAEGSTLDLNEADTTALQRIPGIGSYYSGKICRYRERLGGFISVSQIAEVEGLPPQVERWFTVAENVSVRQIDINKATFRDLVRHPYLSYEQVKVITDYIHKHGSLRGWEDLRLCEQFSEKDFNRLRPYFVFQ